MFTKPSDRYASVSMVDIAYISSLPQELQKIGLLAAPYAPTDGMNECGLTVALMSVPNSDSGHDPGKVTITHNNAIRLLLNYAGNVDEAVSLLDRYNVSLEHGGIHYLIGDSSGKSVIVEFVDGEMQVLPNNHDWQAATNFMISNREKGGGGQDRYQAMCRRLSEKNGRLTQSDALALLRDVAKKPTKDARNSTLWSVTYNMFNGNIQIAMGSNYDKIYDFKLTMNV